MIFGDKSSFAIEIEIDEIYNDCFIGDGFFIVFINGVFYGRRERNATSFPSTLNQLSYFIDNMINTDISLENKSKEDISIGYYCQNYSEKNLSCYNKDFLEKTCNLITWSPDEAFDDGSYVIHFDNAGKTRIIGFKSCMENDNCMVKFGTENEIVICREEFERVLKETCDYLISLK